MIDRLKPLVRPARDLGLGWRAWTAANPHRSGIHAYYGLPVPSTASTALTGGLVKLAALQERFPNEPAGFNLLYLVSSRLPAAAPTIARLAQRKGTRFVLNQDGVAYPAWFGAGWERANEPLAQLVHGADHVFFQSAFCQRGVERFLGPRRGPAEVLYNAVDTQVFAPAANDPAPGALVLLLAGSHKHAYRVTSAVRALALLPAHVRLLIAGRLAWTDEAQALSEVDALLQELGVAGRVTLVGAYRQTEAPALFQRCHMLVHTQYNDACPSVVLEALACGLPVVYSASGGTPELVGEAGVGVPAEEDWAREHPPTPAALASAITEAAERRTALAFAARARAVARFDVRPWVQRHAEVFASVLA